MTAFKAGDSQLRRAGHSTGLGVEFDVYWVFPGEMECLRDRGPFCHRVWAGRPAEGQEGSPQGHPLARRS